MNSRQFILAVALVAVVSLTSCSGSKTHCTVNCGGSGSASLSLTLGAEPLTPPPGTSILSFAVVVNSVSLTPSSGGSDVSIPLNNSAISVDLTRAVSDSIYLGQFIKSVPAGTYKQLSVNLSAVVTYCAATAGTPGCKSGSIAQISKSFASPTTSNFSLTLAANQQAGLRVVVNFANALTVNSTSQTVTAVDLTASNVITTVTLPPANSTLSTGELDYVDDVTGVVTAASSTSVTIQTATRGPITSAITGTTIGSSNCVILNQACKAAVGQVASMDVTLNSDGTSSMLQYDPLSPTSVDLIEGIVTSEASSSTQFQIVANDYVPASSSSRISGLSLGDTVNVTLSNVNPFFVDSKDLTVYGTFQGSTDASNVHTGQTVMLRVVAFTAKSGNTPASATVDAVVLRFTRFAAAASSAGANQFGVQSLPPFFGLAVQPLVQVSTGSPITYLDGYTNSGSISVGDSLGIRALYFGPSGVSANFSAAKIRKN